MSPSRSLGDPSNIKPSMQVSSSDGAWNGETMWTGNPFALNSDKTKSRIIDPAVFEEAHETLKHLLDSTDSTSCPRDSISAEFTLKPRPAPIYQDKLHEEYWTFLKSMPDVQTGNLGPPTRCPSLMSGGTLSSRNSSTRSTRSSLWDASEDQDSNVRGVCLIPECSGLCFKDADAHTRITHFKERLVEACPVKTCERHLRGFTRAGDKKRHVFTHFQGILACGFCKTDSTCFSQASDRVDLFLTHLIKKHGVKPQQIQRYSSSKTIVRKSRNSSPNEPVATCSVCSEPFSAQILYEHLPGCILRSVTRNEESNNLPTPEEYVTAEKDDLDLPSPICEDASAWNSQDDCEPELLQTSVESTECKDIEELTVSSRCLSLTSSKMIESSEEETDWTEETASRESSPGMSQLPRRLSPAKRRVVETIMQEFQRLFSKGLRTHTTNCSSSGSSNGGYSGWSSNTSTYSSASFVSRKRSLSGGGSTPPNDDDDSNKRRRPDENTGEKQAMTEARFACPYYKRSPGRHPTFTSCRDPGFSTVSRLKEHLYRRHLLPPQCHRCCKTFTNDIALREHQRDPRGCKVKEQMPLEGFDKDQERRLKSKKRSLQYQSEEDKWKGVYRILFPDDNEADMPSAYVEYQPCTGGQAPETSSNVTQHFQEFSRLELPRLVRRTLESVVEQEAQPLEDKLKERLVDIVKECQTQLVNMFQVAGGGGGGPAAMTVTHPPPSPPEASIQQSGSGGDDDKAFEVFPGFDSSLPVRTMAPALNEPFTEWMDTTMKGSVQPTYPPPPPHQTSGSGSPDSFEYDSANWTTVSTNLIIPPPPPTIYVQHDDLVMLQSATTTGTTTATAAGASNEYVLVGLEGYYDVFQEQQERASGLHAEFDPVAAWAFVDAMPASDASELTTSELGPGWGV